MGSSPISWVIETSFTPILRELPDVKFQLEVIAEKAAERMDDHHIERRGLRRARFDHPLELGAPIIGGRCARLHVGLDDLVAARGAIGFTLLALIGNGDIVLGLPRRRDAQVKGGAHRHGHGSALLRLSAGAEHRGRFEMRPMIVFARLEAPRNEAPFAL
jgi:hypothetical protein